MKMDLREMIGVDDGFWLLLFSFGDYKRYLYVVLVGDHHTHSV